MLGDGLAAVTTTELRCQRREVDGNITDQTIIEPAWGRRPTRAAGVTLWLALGGRDQVFNDLTDIHQSLHPLGHAGQSIGLFCTSAFTHRFTLLKCVLFFC